MILEPYKDLAPIVPISLNGAGTHLQIWVMNPTHLRVNSGRLWDGYRQSSDRRRGVLTVDQREQIRWAYFIDGGGEAGFPDVVNWSVKVR